jgi:ABC-type sugar transport system ATPase subunit
MEAPAGLSAIRCRDVSRRFRSTVALAGINFDLKRGEVHALVGENGAGKSTLLGILAGRIAASAGSVDVGGVPLASGDPRASRQAGIVAIYQELTIVPALTAVANVFLGQTLSKAGILSTEQMIRQFEALCADLHVRIPPKALAGTLSVADQQMLEIMRAIAARADIMLLDEPTAALAPPERTALFGVVERLRGQGVTMLLVSHNLDEVMAVADQITVLRNGRIVESRRATDWTKQQLVHGMLGRDLDLGSNLRAGRRPLADDTPAVLRVEGLTIPRRLANVSFRLRRGEILGVGGLVGSGRTSMLRALAGLEPKATGRMWINGHEVPWPRTPLAAIRRGICLIPEDRKDEGLALAMTAAENICMSGFHDVARFGVLSRTGMLAAAERSAAQYGLPTRMLTGEVRNLSGGNQQKVLLARWAHRRPLVLLADEPTRGVDIGAKEEILKSLDRAAQQDVSIIFVSSELEEVAAISDKVEVLSSGTHAASLTNPRDVPFSVHDILRAAFRVAEAI